MTEQLEKVIVVQDFWYDGNRYIKGERLTLPLYIIQKMGIDNFENVKMLIKPPYDKMVF